MIGALTLVAGCAGTVKNMRDVAGEPASITPQGGNAVVIFMRPSGLGFAIQSSVFDVTDNGSSLVGIVAAKKKVAYAAGAGHHLFMVVGESADFMDAELLPGKVYYALVTPRMGFWKARFSLAPIHQDDLGKSDFSSWLADCAWVEKGPESDAWARENAPSIEDKRAEYYKKWMSKPDSDRPQLRDLDGKSP